MKKYMIIAFFGMISLVINAQSKYTLGINSGLDHSFNSAYSDYYKRTATPIDYNMGIYISRAIGQKYRLRLEMQYYKIGIGQDWTGAGTSPTEPVKSTKRIFSLGGNLRLDYKIGHLSKFDFFISPALKGNVPIGSYENTKTYDGNLRTSHYIDPGYRHTLAAGAMGLLIKYNVNAHLGIVLTPEYTYYFRKFYYKCVSPLQTISASLGAEWTF
jgi:hypothetical protein